jgi:hypothetical protein
MRPWAASHASGVRLRCILGRATAWCRVGLRSDRMHAKRPEDPAPNGQRPPQPARALPAQIKLASPCYPVRRADRRPAPITRLSHLAPPVGPGTRPLFQLDCPPLHICLPGPAAGAATGHRAPSPGPEPGHAAPVIAAAPGRRSAPQLPGPLQQDRGVPRGHHQPVPLHQYRATAPPARYRTVPESRPGAEDSKHLQAPSGPGSTPTFPTRTVINAAEPDVHADIADA